MSDVKLWYAYTTDDERAAAMVNVARSLWRDQGEARRRNAEDALTLWSGSTQHSLTGSNPLGVLGLINDTSAYNVVQAIVDTKANATLRNEVRPLFVTEGGDSELKEKVEAMQDACDGQRYSLGLEDEMEEQACWNGYIFGSGGVEFWPDTANSRIMVSPVWDFNYFVSRQEARSGAPQQLFGRYVIPRDVLASFVADQPKEVRDAVDGAPSASAGDARMYDTTEPGQVADLVVIFKAWHLPSSRVDLEDPRSFGKGKDGSKVKPKHDGMHLVALDGGDKGAVTPLISRPWPYDHYPVAWFKPNRVPGSYWGRGEPEILATSQMEANQWNERIYQILDRYARPGIILGKGAKLNPAQINNALFNVWQVEGNVNGAMTVLNEPAVSPDLINRLDRLPSNAREQRGMSEMSMTAQKPAGVNHEPGLAYLANTESIRHTAEFRAWKRFKLDCDKNIVWCFKELSEHDPEFEVVYEKDDQLVRARLQDIDPGAEKYRIKAKGTNLFSQDPAQQADQIADFVDRGLLPPKALFDAVKSPDLQALADSKEIMRKNAIARVKDVAKGPDYTEDMMPQAYNDLQTMKEECIKMLNFVELNKESPDKIDRLTAFLADVDKELGIVPADPNAIAAGNPALANAPGMAQAMGGAPPAPGGPPPPMGAPAGQVLS